MKIFLKTTSYLSVTYKKLILLFCLLTSFSVLAQETPPFSIERDFSILENAENALLRSIDTFNLKNDWYSKLLPTHIKGLESISTKIAGRTDHESQLLRAYIAFFKSNDLALDETQKKYQEAMDSAEVAISILKKEARTPAEFYTKGMAHSLKAYSLLRLFLLDDALLETDNAIVEFDNLHYTNLLLTEWGNKGETYYNMGNERELKRAIDSADTKINKSTPIKFKVFVDKLRARLLDMQQLELRQIGKQKEADKICKKGIEGLKKSLSLLETIKNDPTQINPQEYIQAYSLLNTLIGVFYGSLSEGDDSDNKNILFYAQRAPVRSAMLEAVGYYKTKQLSMAAQKIQMALMNKNSPFFETLPLTFGLVDYIQLLPGQYNVKGRIAKAFYDSTKTAGQSDLRYLQASYTNAIKAVMALDSLRMSFSMENTQQFGVKKFAYIYKDAAWIAAQIVHETENKAYADSMLICIEKQKAFILRNSIYRNNYKKIFNNPHLQSLYELEQSRKRDIIFAQNKWANGQKNKDLLLLNTAKAVFISFLDSLQKGDAVAQRYFITRFSDSIPSVRDIQKKWLHTEGGQKKAKAYLNFSFLTNGYVALLIMPDTIIVSTQVLDASFWETFDKLREGINIKDSGKFVANSYAVYNKLMKDIVAKIPIGTHIVISADGPLRRLPFELLLTSPVDIKDIEYDKMPYLIRKYRISYVSSFATQVQINELWRKRQQNTTPHIGIVKSKTVDIAAIRHISDDVLKMYENNGEVFEYQSLSPESKETIKQDFLNQSDSFDALYFATHGVADIASDPRNYALILRNPRDSAINRLRVEDIESASFSRLDLTVFGACETQVGNLDSGEGLLSLSRSFQMQGSQHIIATLNSVLPDPTARILKQFFTNYRTNKMSVSEALHQAKLKYLDDPKNDGSHPHFWGNLIHLGDDD